MVVKGTGNDTEMGLRNAFLKVHFFFVPSSHALSPCAFSPPIFFAPLRAISPHVSSASSCAVPLQGELKSVKTRHSKGTD